MVTTNLLKKIIITLLIALGYLYGACGLSKSEASEVIRVALVHDQTTAEISSDSDFVVQEAGAKTVVAKGKYFLHVVEGKVVLDKIMYIFHKILEFHRIKRDNIHRYIFQGVFPTRMQKTSVFSTVVIFYTFLYKLE